MNNHASKKRIELTMFFIKVLIGIKIEHKNMAKLIFLRLPRFVRFLRTVPLKTPSFSIT